MFFNKLVASTLTSYIMFIGVAKAFNGEATYYKTGKGNCGVESKDTDFIVALSLQEYGAGTHCYKHVKITYQGKTIDATVVDSCQGCHQYDIDLSPEAFKALAPISAGRIPVTWNYV